VVAQLDRFDEQERAAIRKRAARFRATPSRPDLAKGPADSPSG